MVNISVLCCQAKHGISISLAFLLHAGADSHPLTSIFLAHHSELFMCRSFVKLSQLDEEDRSNNV